jgi:hypothetical protein
MDSEPIALRAPHLASEPDKAIVPKDESEPDCERVPKEMSIMTPTEVSSPNIEPLRTDSMVCEEVRSQLKPLLGEICKILDYAASHGLVAGFAIQKNAIGRHVCNQVDINKPM